MLSRLSGQGFSLFWSCGGDGGALVYHFLPFFLQVTGAIPFRIFTFSSGTVSKIETRWWALSPFSLSVTVTLWRFPFPVPYFLRGKKGKSQSLSNPFLFPYRRIIVQMICDVENGTVQRLLREKKVVAEKPFRLEASAQDDLMYRFTHLQIHRMWASQWAVPSKPKASKPEMTSTLTVTSTLVRPPAGSTGNEMYKLFFSLFWT